MFPHYNIYNWFFFVGYLINNESFGGSVGKAKDPKKSIIKLIHNIWNEINQVSFPIHEHINTKKYAIKLTVNWSCKNPLIFSLIDLP